MGNKSVPKKLSRLDRPRVHLLYEVNTSDAIEVKELSFVVGIMADLSGQPTQPTLRMKDRKYIEVNQDNFGRVVENMKPRVTLSVKNTLTSKPDVPNLNVELNVMNMKDFEPGGVIAQVKPLRELLDLRVCLSELRGNVLANEKLDELLFEVAENTEKLQKLEAELELREMEGVKNATPIADRDVGQGLLDQIIGNGHRRSEQAGQGSDEKRTGSRAGNRKELWAI